ncbi:MAG: MFS transporter [Desulfobacterales bacterium]
MKYIPATRIDWWLTGLCLGRAMGQTVAMVYAGALPILLKEWEMSAAVAGSITSGYQIGYAVSLLVISTLADRFGSKMLYIASTVGGAILAMAFAVFAREYFSAQLLYTLVGLAIGGSYTTGLILVTERYPSHRRGMAVGFYIASSPLGYVMSLGLSGLTLPLGGYALSFYATAIVALAGGVLSWITLAGTRDTVTPRRKQQSFRKEVLGNRPAVLLITAYTLHCWELLGLWAWTPAFMTACLVRQGSLGLTAAGLGAYVAAGFHLAGLVASFTMGALSDRVGRAGVIVVMASISTLCSLFFGWTIELPLMTVLAIGIVYSFAALGDSPVLSVGLTEVVSPAYLGTAFGLRSLFGFGAGAISPVVFGAVLDWTNPHGIGQEYYANWGWAFVILGLPGFGAVWAARSLNKN